LLPDPVAPTVGSGDRTGHAVVLARPGYAGSHPARRGRRCGDLRKLAHVGGLRRPRSVGGGRPAAGTGAPATHGTPRVRLHRGRAAAEGAAARLTVEFRP